MSSQRALSRMLIYLCPVQEQAIGDDGNTAHGHGQRRKYGVQLSEEMGEEFEWIQHARRNGDEDDVVEECPKEVLFHGSHSGPAESYCL